MEKGLRKRLNLREHLYKRFLSCYTVEPRYTEGTGWLSMIRYNEEFGKTNTLFVTKSSLKSSNIRYIKTFVTSLLVEQKI